MRRPTLTAPLLLASVILLLAGRPAGADPVEAPEVIGMQLKPVVDAFGLPQSMFTFRGSDETRDDVVFFYTTDHMYLFWYKDRVWQVRFDRRATATVHGVSLGMNRAGVEAAVVERPLVSSGDSLYFDLDGTSIPVRVRLAFTGDAVSDIYVYRSDF
jgi:hypothetical protein